VANNTGRAGPDPRRVHDLDDLAKELGLLLARAARGTGRQRVTLSELTRRLGLPPSSKSTVHSYVSGKTLPPADLLDSIVIELGATPDEIAEWGEAWFRVTARRPHRRVPSMGARPASSAMVTSVTDALRERLRRTETRRLDFCAIGAQNLDRVHQVDLIAPDHESQVTDPVTCPGGSGSNTAFALAQLGVRTGVVGAVAADPAGVQLKSDLIAAGIDTSLLLTIDHQRNTGNTLVFSDGDGRRLIYVNPGVNESLAAELEHRNLTRNLHDLQHQVRVLHLSSFTGAAERIMQEGIARSLDDDVLLSFTPGALYAALGADRLATILVRANLLFLYEQHLDSLLARSSAGTVKGTATIAEKMTQLYGWRSARGSTEPLAIVVKRPTELVRGRPQEYLAIGYGRRDLEDIGGPDTGIRRQDVVDSTGAGDALAAGFSFAMLRQRSPEECANIAYVMAMCASSGLGPRVALPHLPELPDRWRRHLPGVLVPAWLLAAGRGIARPGMEAGNHS
jgi:ribokinase